MSLSIPHSIPHLALECLGFRWNALFRNSQSFRICGPEVTILLQGRFDRWPEFKRRENQMLARCLMFCSFVVAVSAAAEAEVVSGNDLLAACRSDGDVQLGFCTGYMVGVIEGLRFGAVQVAGATGALSEMGWMPLSPQRRRYAPSL